MILKSKNEYNTVMALDILRDTPSSTRTTDQVKDFAWLWETRKKWTTVTFAIRVLVDHHPVHDFFE